MRDGQTIKPRQLSRRFPFICTFHLHPRSSFTKDTIVLTLSMRNISPPSACDGDDVNGDDDGDGDGDDDKRVKE